MKKILLVFTLLYDLMIFWVIERCIETEQFNLRVLIGILFAVALSYLMYKQIRIRISEKKKEKERLKEQQKYEGFPYENIRFTDLMPFRRYEYKKYSYTNVRVFTPDSLNFDSSLIEVGKCISLQTEPSNPYDKNAVAVYRMNVKVGYLYRGKLQDMANDYLHRYEDEVFGYIDSSDNRSFTIALGFYKGSNSFGWSDDEYEDDKE